MNADTKIEVTDKGNPEMDASVINHQYIYLDFKVKNNAAGKTIKNTANVNQLKNASGSSVSDSDGSTNNKDMDYIKVKEAAIKLEKYVSQVELNSEGSAREGYPIYEMGNYKKNTPVKVPYKNAIIRYTIKLENVGEANIYKATIAESFDSKLKYDSTCYSYVASGAGSVSVSSNGKTITYTNTNGLKPGESVKISYELFANATEGLLENTAEVTKIYNKDGVELNDATSNDNKDQDWGKLVNNAVGIEKYIIKVEGSRTENISGRSEEENFWSESRFNKSLNPVLVKKGDLITYNILLKNTGEDNIKIKEFYDYYPDGKLEYVNNSVSSSYGGTKSVNNSGGKLTITFSNPTNIAPGESVSVTLKFKVSNSVAGGEKLENIAQIIEIKDEYNKNTPDTDGSTNNKDSDWIEIELDAMVKLEKYVSKVTNVDGTTTYDSTRKGHPTYDQKGYSKENNPVSLEVGDMVYYNVVITNSGKAGDNADIRIKEFYDTPDSRLTFKGVTGLGSPSGNVSGGKVTINIAGEVVLKPGESATYTLQFEVLNGDTSTKIKNAANIDNIYSKAGDKVLDDVDGDTNNTDSDWVKLKISSVKLEKYVVEVTDKNGGHKETPATNREGHPDYDNDDKKNAPVQLEVGDIVTFRIKVTNNGETEIRVKEIVENFDGRLTYVSVNSTYGSNVQFSGNKISINNADRIPVNGSVYIDIKFQVKVPYDETDKVVTLYNTAKVEKIYNKNDKEVTDKDGPTNNIDSDWVKTKVYKVKLEKFVIEVTDKNGGHKEIPNPAREGHPTYAPNGFSKENKPVRLEVGDIVTFRIKVTNNGETEVAIKEIKESFDSYLKYHSCAPGTAGTNAQLDGDTIKITGQKLMAPSASVYVDIKFTVDVPYDETAESVKPKNTATVHGISNRNEIDVKDNDGPDNNTDSDWVETKLYKVSLEKYVVEVTDAKGNPDKLSDLTKLPNREGSPDYAKKDVKKNEPVQLEVGDLVTFRIKVINNGETEVAIKEITESFESKYLKDPVCIVGTAGSNAQLDGDTIKIDKPVLIPANGGSVYVDIKFRVEVPFEETINSVGAKNTATIKLLSNRNEKDVKDMAGDEYNNTDSDWIETKVYKVSIEKIVVKVDDKEITGRADKPEHKKDNDPNTIDPSKYGNVVTVNSGSKVTYKITVTNNGETKVRFDEVADYLPDGVKYYYNDKWTDNKGGQYDPKDSKGPTVTFKTDNKEAYSNPDLIEPGSSISADVEVTVIENNYSLNLLKNVAEIIAISNRNEIPVMDNTQNDNKDADYIQLEDPQISGLVFNDLATGKPGISTKSYDALYKWGVDKPLEGIKVNLIRDGKEIASTKTNSNGEYFFNKNSIASSIAVNERYIKGPRDANNNLWAGTYYSYIIEFEYDGVTYTSSPDGKSCRDVMYEYDPDFKSMSADNFVHPFYAIDSNATEKTSERKTFNDKFAVINNATLIDGKPFTHIAGKTIKYSTRNEEKYIPQSNHISRDEKGYLLEQYRMKSYAQFDIEELCKGKETIDEIKVVEERLTFVGLALRGRDSFDLELMSDVYATQVTVNGVQGLYNYNSNKIKVRGCDTDYYNYEKDAANPYSEVAEAVGEYDQGVRKDDFDNSHLASYGKTETGLKIKVIYRISVINASKTPGTATKVTNYYDDNYTFIGAYQDVEKAKEGKDDGKLSVSGKTPDYISKNYGYVTVTTGWDTMKQGESKDIYIVYNLIDAEKLLKPAGITEFPTYNMSEITEYKNDGTNEATKGLIDLDSAPGSVDREQVRLTTTEGKYVPGSKITVTLTGVDLIKDESGKKLKTLKRDTEVTLLEDNVEYGGEYWDKIKLSDGTEGYVKDGYVATIPAPYNTPTVGGNPTTLAYYFNESNDLSKLKYEDDTYTAPTLIFVENNTTRKLTGYVFEDNTIKDKTTKIKTGDGKLGPGEVGIKGVVVELYEVRDDGSEKHLWDATTGENGQFIIMNFLPGKYYIRYRYGNSSNNVLINEHNKKSYNGEDFQATNNGLNDDITGEDIRLVEDKEGIKFKTSKLSEYTNYWYVFNEAKDEQISTAIDNSGRRLEVSHNVTQFNDNQMTSLNQMRDGVPVTESGGVAFVIEKTNMFADTQVMHFTVEETVELAAIDNRDELIDNGYIVKKNAELGEWAKFPDTENKDSENPYKEYKIEGMNFGLAEVPVVTIDIEKHVQGFTIKDSTGENIIAEAGIDSGAWKVKIGIVDYANAGTNPSYSVQIEDEKLQGARLEVEYNITTSMDTEKNFDNTTSVEATIDGVVDYVSNNLSYNEELSFNYSGITGKNSDYWEVITHNQALAIFEQNKFLGVTPEGTVDPDGKEHSVVLKARETVDGSRNPLLLESDGIGTVPIVLEKILSAPETTLEEIITSTVQALEFSNTVEISKLTYKGTGKDLDGDPTTDDIMRDRVRRPNRYIILAGSQHDSATAEVIAIIPPLGDTSIHIVYFIIGAISLAVLAIGVFGIKKFVVKK